jgi:hypothetical protein
MSPRLVALALLGMIASVPSGQARITQVRIDRVETFADGAAFGTTGAYQRLTGVAQCWHRRYRAGAAQRRREG